MGRQTFELVPHLAHAPVEVREVRVSFNPDDPYWLRLRWVMEGAGKIIVPPFARRVRRDELWRTTCFELFVQANGSESYCEFNFSPSQAWASYDFDDYREGMRERELPRAPVISWRGGKSALTVCDVAVPRSGLPSMPYAFNLTAIIEEEGGRNSYWALRHPNGPPDFHDPACFAGMLEAPAAP